ncbi:MAG: glyA [Chlamydiales bacterium]|jgi:glycine hydroxymethyltransferase|nr:glyA [Chlamydiales bacterium]
MSPLRTYLNQTPIEQQQLEVIAYLASLESIAKTAPEVSKSIVQELQDQRHFLKLIASENYSSLPVQLAMGNLLTDKYSEGYAHHRFYAGCENVDTIEDLAVQEVKSLFNAEYAYVQPHSGADANLVAYWAILMARVQQPELELLGKKNVDQLSVAEHEMLRQIIINQKMMGMALGSGGHLTHGYRHNISSKMMQSVSYDVDPQTEELDYSAIQQLAEQERPLILIAGYSSYSKKINFAKMKEIADSVDAVLLCDMSHFSGLVAGKVFQGEYNPIPYADVVTSTTHKTLRGPRGGFILAKEEFSTFINKGCPLVLGGPLPHVIAAKLLAFREAKQPSFVDYAHQIVKNAQSLAEEIMAEGLRIVSHGTENHLMVVDVSSLGLNGRQAESALRECGITLNRNAIPNDPNGAWYTSGIRIGTPALTTLGMKEAEMREIGRMIVTVLKATSPAPSINGKGKAQYQLDTSIQRKVRERSLELLSHFKLYPGLLETTSLA